MNMRSHYKSRVMDMTRISFDDYIEDIKEIVAECGEPPIVIGFSMGGILCQKLAEAVKFAGLVLIDSSISKKVRQIAPYQGSSAITEIVIPAPIRDELSIDESADDIAFQKKYLSMESSKALNASSYGANAGIPIDGSLITCPCLVIKAVNSDDDNIRGSATAEQLNAEYAAFMNTSHTGLLVGERYMEVVDRIMKWLKQF
jgi:pimeloyl-ACP methyl ester carboxylesterase